MSAGAAAAGRRDELARHYFRWPGGRSDPRWVMMGILGTFTLLGQTVLGFMISPAQIVCAILVCALWDVAFHRTMYGSWVLPRSGLISGLGLGLLLRGHGYYIFLFAGTLTIASKHMLKYNGKHIWNPTNFGTTFALLLVPGAHFIVDQWGRSTAIVWLILNIGMFCIYRVRRFDVVISFLGCYLLLNAAWAAQRGFMLNGYGFWETVHMALTPAALIFTFFMITDPRTAPATRPGRLIYGSSTALVAVLLTAHGQPGLFYGLFLVLPFVPLLDRWLVGRELPVRPGGRAAPARHTARGGLSSSGHA